MELRSTIIRLAHAKPELRGVLLPLLTKEAADPKYQTYVEKKRKQGEKPLSKEQWEVKVLGKKPEAGGGKAPEGEGGEKGEKGEKGEGKGSKKKDISPEREKAIGGAITNAFNGAMDEHFPPGRDPRGRRLKDKSYSELLRDPESADGVIKTITDATKRQFQKEFDEYDITTQDEYDQIWDRYTNPLKDFVKNQLFGVLNLRWEYEYASDTTEYDETFAAEQKKAVSDLRNAAKQALEKYWKAPKVPKGKTQEAPEKGEKGEKPAKTFKKNYRPKMEGVMTKHGLTDDDADQVIKFSLDRPKKGKPQSPEELKRRFMEKAKPETKERMKNMTAAEFMVMLRAILDQEEGEMGKMASRILKQASGDAALLALLKVACGYMAEDDEGEGKESCGTYMADDKEAKQMHEVKQPKGKGLTVKLDPQRDPYARSLQQGQFKPKTIGDKRQKIRDKFKD